MRFYAADRPWGDILPRYTFLEFLFRGGRILEIGCGDGTGARFILGLGAERVLGVDSSLPDTADRTRAKAAPGISFAVLDGSRLDVPSASIDVVVGFDLWERDTEDLLGEIQRVLSPEGHFVTSVPNPEHLSFADLAGSAEAATVSLEEALAVLQDRFPRVSVIAQTPFLGFSVGWMGAETEDLPLEMDTALLDEGGDDVAYYLVVCGQNPIDFESQSLVQLPYRTVFKEVFELSGEAEEVNAETDAGQPARAATPERERESDRRHQEELERLHAQAENRIREAGAESVGLRSRLEEAERARDDLQQRLQDASAGLELARREVGNLRGENEVLRRSSKELEEKLAGAEEDARRSRTVAEDLQRDTRRHDDQLAEKLSWLEGARGEVERLQEVIREHERAAEADRRQILDLQKQVREQKARPAADDARLARFKQEKAALNRTIRQLREEVGCAEAARREWEQERVDLLSAGRERQAVLEETRQQVDGLREEVERWSGDCQEVRDRAVQLERACAEGEERERQLVARLSEVENRADQDIQRLKQLLAQERNKGSALLAEREVLQAEMSDRQEETLVLRHRLTEESGKAVDFQKRLAEQDRRNRELESDLVDLVNRLEAGKEVDHDRQRFVDMLQGRVAAQQTGLDESAEKIDDLTKELYSARKHEEELTAAMELMREALVEQERSREALEIEVSNLRLAENDNLRQIEERAKKAEMTLADVRLRLERNAEDREQAERAIERLRSETGHLNRELRSANNREMEMEARLKEAEALAERLKDTEHELAWHREEVDRISTELQTRVEEWEEAQWELERTQEELERSQEDLDENRRQLSLVTTRARESEKERHDLEETIDRLGNDLEEARRRHREADDRLVAVDERVRALEQELDLRTGQLEDTNRRIEEEQERNRNLQQRLEAADEQLRHREAALRQELSLSSEREQTLQARVAALQQQMGELEEKTSTDISSLSEHLRRREEQLSSLTSRLAAMDDQAQSSGQQAEELREQLTGEHARVVADLDEQLQASRARVTELEEEVASVRSQAQDQLERQSEESQNRIQEMEARLALARARESQPAGSAQEKARLEADLSESRRRVGELEAELLRLREEKNRREQAHEHQIGEFHEQLQSRTAELEQTRTQGQDDSHWKQALEDRDGRIKLLERQLSDRVERINRLLAELSKLKGRAVR